MKAPAGDPRSGAATPSDGRADDGSARTASLLVVSPCRDEAKYCRTTIESMIRQTVRPSLWVIVDDGSTDATPSILAEYAGRHPWIRIVRRDDRGVRSVGPGVVDAFYAGLGSVNAGDYKYLCKLDLDLDLPPAYFEGLIGRMEADATIGTCSGKPYLRDPESGSLRSERIGDDVSAGMTKLYRSECFAAIGGFVREVMWDGIDCHMCRMLGWKALSWDDPGLRFVHLRQMGSSYRGLWTGRLRWGRGKWFMGSTLPYMIAVSCFRMLERPYVVGGAGILAGYLAAMVSRSRRLEDPRYRRFVRRYELLTLLVGKRRAGDLCDRAAARGTVGR